MILGIFGKIASGKSTLALRKQKEEPEMDWKILDLDYIGHEVLGESKIQEKIRQIFLKADIFTQGKIDRQKLGKIIFSDVSHLQKLEKIVHPFIEERVKVAIEKARNNDENLMILSALPEKIDLEDFCDEVIHLNVSKEEAWKRIEFSRDLSWEEFEFLWSTQV